MADEQPFVFRCVRNGGAVQPREVPRLTHAAVRALLQKQAAIRDGRVDLQVGLLDVAAEVVALQLRSIQPGLTAAFFDDEDEREVMRLFRYIQSQNPDFFKPIDAVGGGDGPNAEAPPAPAVP